MYRFRHTVGFAAVLIFASVLHAQSPSNTAAAKTDSIEAKLRQRTSIKLDTLTAEQAIQKLQETHPLNLVIDWDGLKDKGLSRTQVLSGELTNVTIFEAITVVLQEAGCFDIPPVTPDGNLMRIIAQPKTETRVYVVSKILDRLQHELAPPSTAPSSGVPVTAADRLVQAINSHVEPETWRDNGGTIGSITTLGFRLVITQTPAALEKIESLLKQLEKDDAK